MRFLQKTISIFLAVQLLVSFGLCGGLCCIKAAELSVPQIVEQAAGPEENLPPCHRKIAAEKNARQTHSAETIHPTDQAAAGKAAAGKAAPAMLNRNCCAMKHEAPEGESLPSTAAPQIGKVVVLLATSPWFEDDLVFQSVSVPIPLSAIHSPPTGFQLSLRI